jgi:flagellar P-ring protein FlgI
MERFTFPRVHVYMRGPLVRCIAASCLALLTAACAAAGAVRLKDVAQVKDQSEVQLVGYGLVAGLKGTGDGKNTQFTIQSIGNMMKRMGIEVPAASIKVKNVAAVMVTATVSPYVKTGGTFDVVVSSVGDAKSIEGGTLLRTPLVGEDDILYAEAQGPLSIGGQNKNYGGQAAFVRNIDLTGTVPNGGILSRELPTIETVEKNFMVTLRSPDYTTAFRLATAINEYFKEKIASARDAGCIVVNIPSRFHEKGDLVQFVSEMESVTFVPDEEARVVINERTGTIVAGGNVSLGSVSISHGTLSLAIAQPQGQAAAAQPAVGQAPSGDRVVNFGETANAAEVAKALNLLGVTPRDIIAIFEALKRAGSLRAELIII